MSISPYMKSGVKCLAYTNIQKAQFSLFVILCDIILSKFWLRKKLYITLKYKTLIVAIGKTPATIIQPKL